MNTSLRRSRFLSLKTRLVLLAAIVSATGCVQVRLLTYPSEFHWLDSTSVQSVMHELAFSMDKLDTLVDRTADTAKAQHTHAAIIAELLNIEAQAVTLSGSTTNSTDDAVTRPATNHLLIDEHIDDFVNQTMRARFLAEADPPNYYGIGQLTGTCNACHRMR